MKLGRCITIEDLSEAAKKRLPKLAFDYIEGGVEAERCLVRNRQVFDEFRLLPRYFVDISNRNQRCTVFGRTFDSPIGICPTGLAGLWRPNADSMLAQAAAARNIPFALSCASNNSIEDTVRHAPNNMWFQLYTARDREFGRKFVSRIGDLGVETLVITADVPVLPKRERNTRNGFTRPLKFKLSTVIDGLSRPKWLLNYLRTGGGVPMMPNIQPYCREGASADEVADYYSTHTPASEQTWADLEVYRKLWPGNLVVKGILHPDDAKRAESIGVNGIVVSNHGGRQLDMAPSPIEVLPLIREAVDDRMVLMMDSGIRRGSDVVIALCLGAQLVFFGRPTLFGVAAFGLPGALKAIDILRTEIDLNMAQMGCPTLDAMGPHCLMDRESAYRIGVPTAAPSALSVMREVANV